MNESVLLGSASIFLISLLVLWILQIVSYWRLFTKAGEAGWKSIIPFYAQYKLYDLTWKNYIFWIVLALTIVASFLISMETIALIVIGYLLNVVLFVLGIISQIKLSKAYGKGIGFAIGLIILYPIFILILGLGSSKYVGSQN